MNKQIIISKKKKKRRKKKKKKKILNLVLKLFFMNYMHKVLFPRHSHYTMNYSN